MAIPLIPAFVVDSIFELRPQVLHAHDIRLVLTDLDNTLAPYEQALPSNSLIWWKEELESEGIPLYVISNSRKERRCADFCAALGVDCVQHAGKPGIAGFQQALEQTGVAPEHAIMMGDQIFTDIWGANRAGITAVLVKPISWGDNPLRAVRYLLESPFRLAARRK